MSQGDAEWIMDTITQLRAENARLRAAILKLVYREMDGRWYGINGDGDVTDIVGPILNVGGYSQNCDCGMCQQLRTMNPEGLSRIEALAVALLLLCASAGIFLFVYLFSTL
jgi:hypothetical protein